MMVQASTLGPQRRTSVDAGAIKRGIPFHSSNYIDLRLLGIDKGFIPTLIKIAS